MEIILIWVEQKGWAIDPIPNCSNCSKQMIMVGWIEEYAEFECPDCHIKDIINPHTWNEENSNGKKGKN